MELRYPRRSGRNRCSPKLFRSADGVENRVNQRILRQCRIPGADHLAQLSESLGSVSHAKIRQKHRNRRGVLGFQFVQRIQRFAAMPDPAGHVRKYRNRPRLARLSSVG